MSKSITIDEYVEKCKKELDEFEQIWKKENKKDPENWPMEMPEVEWGDHELTQRFS